MQKEVKVLVDEAERILLALRDGDLQQGDYNTLARAIEGVKSAQQSVQSDGAFCPVCDIQPTSEGICPKCRRVVRRAANANR